MGSADLYTGFNSKGNNLAIFLGDELEGDSGQTGKVILTPNGMSEYGVDMEPADMEEYVIDLEEWLNDNHYVTVTDNTNYDVETRRMDYPRN